MFDIDNLVNFATKKIQEFAKEHKDETFYAFSIDASFLCLNSLSAFKASLEDFQSGEFAKYYQSEEEINNLKYNTGDWKYQGFADFLEEPGWDESLYDKHYYLDDIAQKASEYGKAMDKILEKLIESNVFKVLKTTSDFIINRVEHNY